MLMGIIRSNRSLLKHIIKPRVWAAAVAYNVDRDHYNISNTSMFVGSSKSMKCRSRVKYVCVSKVLVCVYIKRQPIEISNN
jgi:hypothetical protein